MAAEKQQKQQAMDSQAFDRLLSWLDQDRDRAGERYEQIRSRLIKVFEVRGCPVAEDLADATMDRVSTKLPEIMNAYIGNPELYFYGVAQKIHLEYLRRKPPVQALALQRPSTEETEMQHECLEKCLGRLTPRNRRLVLQYYREQGHTKQETRKLLARRLGIGANALRIRVHRIRETLAECLTDCLKRIST